MSVLIISIIKSATVTLITTKTMKALGKIDYADIIKFSGIGVCSITGIELRLICNTIANSEFARIIQWFFQ